MGGEQQTIKYWDPQTSSVQKFVDLGLGTADQYTFSALSNKLLGQAQPKQFQAFDDEQSTDWYWGSKVSADGNWTELSNVTMNANAQMPRSVILRKGSIQDGLYNWFAGSAETGDFSTQEKQADDSICPSGWGLPNGNASGDKSWANLLTINYGIDSANTNVGNVMRSPINMLYTGQYPYDNGSAAGNSRTYSLSFMANSQLAGWSGLRLRGAVQSYVGSNYLVTDHYQYKSTGVSIRCVKK